MENGLAEAQRGHGVVLRPAQLAGGGKRPAQISSDAGAVVGHAIRSARPLSDGRRRGPGVRLFSSSQPRWPGAPPLPAAIVPPRRGTRCLGSWVLLTAILRFLAFAKEDKQVVERLHQAHLQHVVRQLCAIQAGVPPRPSARFSRFSFLGCYGRSAGVISLASGRQDLAPWPPRQARRPCAPHTRQRTCPPRRTDLVQKEYPSPISA